MPDRTDQPTTQPSSQPRENVILGEPATIQNCGQDYEAGAPDRGSVDRNVRNQARRLGRGTAALAVVAALAALALTGYASDAGDAARRVTDTLPTGEGADPSIPDVPTDEPAEDDSDDGMVDLALDDTASYEGGVEVSLGKFTRGVSSEWAAPGNTPYVKFSITFENTGKESADLSAVTLTCQHGDTPGEEIYDSEHGLNGTPASHLRPGRTVTAAVACEMPQDEDYLQVEVQPGLSDVAVFSGQVK